MSSSDSQSGPDFDAYQHAYERGFDQEHEKFEQTVKQKLIISLYGDVNSGKSSLVNALTGMRLADVSAEAGRTREVKLYKLREDVYVSDTPGLNDINEDNSKRAQEFVEKDDTDIILFVFNSGVGAAKPTVDAYKNLCGLEKPIIAVLGKSDVLTSEELAQMKRDIHEKSGAAVLPVSARENTGIEDLHKAIIQFLEVNGKHLLYLKVSRYKDKQVDNWIKGAALTAFGIGSIPIPGADMLPLTALQIGLAMKIAYVYGCKVTKKDVLQVVAATVTGGVGRQVYRWSIQGIKALGWAGGPLGTGAVAAAAGAIAASVTYGFGHACKKYYRSGMTIEIPELEGIFSEMQKRYHKEQASDAGDGS